MLTTNHKAIKSDLSREESSLSNQAYTERSLEFKNSKSKGTIREIKFDSIHIMRISLDILEQTSVPFIAKEPKVVMFFSIQGDSLFNTSNIRNLNIKAGTHNIFYTIPTFGEIQCNTGKYDVFYIGMSAEAFAENVPNDEEMVARFNEDLKKSPFVIMRDEPGLLEHQMMKVVEDISRFDSQEFIKKIFLKGKVTELISLQLNELCSPSHQALAVNTAMSEKMYKVHQFILDHLYENHSLTELARRVGTNEYTLKKEFKALFGNTVFGFWNDVKMENAQKLLTETRKDIQEISAIIGYKNPQHFSTAFKRKYGVTPSGFRKGMNH